MDQITHLEEKLAELKLDQPLLLIDHDGCNTNTTLFLPTAELAAPMAMIVFPDRSLVIIVSPIETDIVAAYSGLAKIDTYGPKKPFIDTIKSYLVGFDKIMVETSGRYLFADRLRFAWREELSEEYGLLSAENVLFGLRAKKTASEAALICEAVRITKEVFAVVERQIVPGVTELELGATLLAETFTRYQHYSFLPIVSSGATRIVNPHPVRATERMLQQGDCLIVDYGVRYCGYCADLTRCYRVGHGPLEDDPFYQVSRQMFAFLESADLSVLTPRKLAQELDLIGQLAGVDQFKKHGYGHGIGVDVHDAYPGLAAANRGRADQPFIENSFFAFEPGFYGQGRGYRHEENYRVLGGRAIML